MYFRQIFYGSIQSIADAPPPPCPIGMGWHIFKSSFVIQNLSYKITKHKTITLVKHLLLHAMLLSIF